VWDDKGKELILTFNPNHTIPHLTDNWYSLLTNYQIEQPKEITFAYYGSSTFHIHVGRLLGTTNDYPSFHSHYIRTTNAKSLLLATQHLDVVKAVILIRDTPRVTTKIGSGWREFCRIGRFQPGDTIRFKFEDLLRSNIVHVRKM
jgi:hypothetical protein